MRSDTKPVRIALAGAGFIGRSHIGWMRKDPVFDIVAAADPAPGSDVYLQQQQIPHFNDVGRMLDSIKPDGVIAATPNQLHEVVALACIERKIPVLVEKPIAHTVESALRICKAAEASGVPVLVGHHRRHNPLIRTAREFIQSGGIGQMVTVAALDLRRKPDAYYQHAWRREPGGGPMLMNGIHDVDCLRWMCGEIESLMAMTANAARKYPVEDTAAVTFKFENGAIGNLTISDAVQAPWAWEVTSREEEGYSQSGEDCFLICGTAGSLAIPSLDFWSNEKGGGRGDPFITKQLFFVPALPWLEELRHFARVIRGEEKPLVDAADGTRTLATTLAVARSAQTGKPVAIKDMYS